MKQYLIMVIFLISTILCTSQEENCVKCGWYVDGVKTDTVKCYSFDKLQIVLPYNEGFEGYDIIDVYIEKSELIKGNRPE